MLRSSNRHPEFMNEFDKKEIRLYGGAGYFRFVQRIYDENIDRDETEQIRVLEKHEGKWLIAYAGAFTSQLVEQLQQTVGVVVLILSGIIYYFLASRR